MATLFFEGFEKGIVFNKLDPNYWSSQYKLFPKYAFGGYIPYSAMSDYDAWDKISATYVYNSPNGGILPSGRYFPYLLEYRDPYSGATYGTEGNRYPQFGTPPGFLAFSNININNPTNVEFPTYLQASGFPLPSGDTTYFSMRCLGLESKHRDSSPYPHRHTLFSYNSGNIPQLTINVVQVTGNSNFIPLNTEYSTLALEIQQNDQTIGYFDLNISQILSRYRIASIYRSDNKILTIADTVSGPYYSAIRSRWSHLEFAVDQSVNPATLSINVEDINLPVINDNIDIPRESWDISLPISGFNFNNLRFYNRTYSSAISDGQNYSWGSVEYTTNEAASTPYVDQPTLGYSCYYMRGQNWLLDDIALIDNVGEPSYFLGSTARVISMIPGNGSLLDNNGITDGVLDWSTNSSAFYRDSRGNYPAGSTPSHRKAILSLDNDNNAIEAINSGTIDAVSFSTFNYGPESSSSWRNTFNDAVGGIKLYNSARKKYLDTKFVNVFISGVDDPYENSVSLLLHGDSLPIVDSTRIAKTVTANNTTINPNNSKFGPSSLSFADSNSYLSVNHSDLAQNPFTIEAWTYFQSNTQIVSLFDKMSNSSNFHGFFASISGIIFKRDSQCDKILLFNQNASTGVWNHMAVTRTPNNDLVCYLNGVAGNSYNICNCEVPRPNESNIQLESQGTFPGKYSFNFVTNRTLSSDTPNLTLGKPTSVLHEDPYYNSVSLLINSNNITNDYSSNPKTIYNNQVITSYDHSRFGDKSIHLQNNSYLSFSNSDDFNFGTDDFCIDFWVYFGPGSLNQNAMNTNYSFLECNQPNGLNILFRRENRYEQYCTGSSTYSLLVYALNNNSSATYANVPCSGPWRGINDYQAYYGSSGTVGGPWNHFAVVRFRGVIYVYINGATQFYSYSHSASAPFNIDCNNFTIGSSNGSSSIDCYIDSFRITKGVPRYYVGPYNFSAPSTPFGNILSAPVEPSVYIDDYRVTYGVGRYSANFTVPNHSFKTHRDNYLNIGPDYNVNKTVYQTYQHYMLKNPATNQQWKLPEVNGITLGVKKL
jgi:Concanavalin A-like lectin/glucanases superfamily